MFTEDEINKVSNYSKLTKHLKARLGMMCIVIDVRLPGVSRCIRLQIRMRETANDNIVREGTQEIQCNRYGCAHRITHIFIINSKINMNIMNVEKIVFILCREYI